MPPLITFFIRRILSILTTLFVVTLVLYGITMLTPTQERAMLYFPNTGAHLTDEQTQRMVDSIIQRYGLDQPFPIQYAHWVARLVQGQWGYSPSAKQDVLQALLQRTPASAELMFYSFLLFIPLGILSGIVAARRQGGPTDLGFQLTAFSATALPPFILALVLLSIFWVGVYWFPLGRLSDTINLTVQSDAFVKFTGLVTIDGLLNGRPDISLDALRHLVLPVFTLSFAHWATLARVTRAAILDELSKEYVLAAKAHGLSQRKILWHHALRNVLVPALNSSALSAASLITSLFVIEIVFLYNGISSLFARSMLGTPDVSIALGFAIYTVLLVLAIMTILDVLQAIVDPRIRAAGALL